MDTEDIITEVKVKDLFDGTYYTYTIIDNDANENLPDNIISCTRPIAEAILKSIGRKHKSFSVNGVDYKIVRRKDSDKLKPYKPVVLKENQTIWVYRLLGNIGCFQNDHDLITTYAFVKSLKTGNIVELGGVLSCSSCAEKKYFVSEASVSSFERVFGELLLTKLNYERYYGLSNDNYVNYGISELYSHGYNVRQGTTSEQRRRKLRSLMDNEIMKKADIIRDLSDNINRAWNNSKYENAELKWREDLLFVQQYRCDTDVVIHGELSYNKK